MFTLFFVRYIMSQLQKWPLSAASFQHVSIHPFSKQVQKMDGLFSEQVDTKNGYMDALALKTSMTYWPILELQHNIMHKNSFLVGVEVTQQPTLFMLKSSLFSILFKCGIGKEKLNSALLTCDTG